jgi:hypothetical protein
MRGEIVSWRRHNARVSLSRTLGSRLGDVPWQGLTGGKNSANQ